MTYQPNIPQPGDLLSDSQSDLLNNFITADAVMGINHYPFSDGTSKEGKHKFVELVNNVTAPSTVNNEGTLYARPFSPSADTDLWYKSDANTFEYQLTRVNTVKNGLFANNTNYPQTPSVADQFGGWTFLPGGIFLQYGIGNVASKGTSTTFKYPISFTGIPFSITLSIISQDASNNPSANNVFIKPGSVTTTQFVVVNSSGSSSQQIYWMAIGV